MRGFGGSPAGVRAALMVAAVSLFVVLAAWATLIGPDEVFTGPGTIERTTTTATPTCLPAEGAGTGPDGTTATTDPPALPGCEEPPGGLGGDLRVEQSDPPAWIGVLAWILVLGVLLGVVALLVLLAVVVRDRLARRGRRVVSQEVEFSALEAPAGLREAIVGDAAEQDALLRAGDPRNAIVAAWQRFEVHGEAAGAGRSPWETSSEYAIRLLDLVSADPGAVTRLAALYREARFSDHPATEEHREAALAALAEIRRSLAVPR